MKKILAMLTILTMMTFAAAALACHPGHPDYPACAAGSVSKTWTDVYNPNPDVYFHGEIGHYKRGKWIVDQAAFDTYSFTFDIKDSGFVPGEDWINSYSIVFDFDDDCDGLFGAPERAKVTVDKVEYYTTDWLWIIDDLNISFKGTTSLNADGTLLTTITRLDGDFYFDSATLTAVGCDFTPPPPPPPPQVPEPASLLLFGLGLLGVAGFRKRMKK